VHIDRTKVYQYIIKLSLNKFLFFSTLYMIVIANVWHINIDKNHTYAKINTYEINTHTTTTPKLNLINTLLLKHKTY
jgi:hypothetical protein